MLILRAQDTGQLTCGKVVAPLRLQCGT